MQCLTDVRLIQRIGRTGQGAGTERHHICQLPGKAQVLEITGQHGKVGHQVVTEENRLGPLQVRIARHDDIVIFFCSLDDTFLKLYEQLGDCRNFPPYVQVRI